MSSYDEIREAVIRDVGAFLGWSRGTLDGVMEACRGRLPTPEPDAKPASGAEAGAVEWRIVPTRTGGFWEVRSTLCVMSDEEGDFPLTIADMRTRAEAEAIRDALNRCGVDPRSLVAAEQEQTGGGS